MTGLSAGPEVELPCWTQRPIPDSPALAQLCALLPLLLALAPVLPFGHLAGASLLLGLLIAVPPKLRPPLLLFSVPLASAAAAASLLTPFLLLPLPPSAPSLYSSSPAVFAALLLAGAAPWRWLVWLGPLQLLLSTLGPFPEGTPGNVPTAPEVVVWVGLSILGYLNEWRDREWALRCGALEAACCAVLEHGPEAARRSLPGAPPALAAALRSASNAAAAGAFRPPLDGLFLPELRPPPGLSAARCDALRAAVLRKGLRSKPATVLLCRATLEAEDCATLQTQAAAFVEEVLAAGHEFHGVVHHLTADAALLCWNAFAFHPTHEAQACHCALDLERRLTLKLGRSFHAVVTSAWFVSGLLPRDGHPPLPVLHGKCVHVARRLLQLCRPLDCRILITDSVHDAVQHQFASLPVDSVQPEGLGYSIRVHALFSRPPFVEPAAGLRGYLAGFAALEARQLAAAQGHFADCLLKAGPEMTPHATRLLHTATHLQLYRGTVFGRRDGWELDRGGPLGPSPTQTPPSGVTPNSPGKRAESPLLDPEHAKRGVRFGTGLLHEPLARKASSLRRRPPGVAVNPSAAPPVEEEPPEVEAPTTTQRPPPPPLQPLTMYIPEPPPKPPIFNRDVSLGSPVTSFRFGRDVSALSNTYTGSPIMREPSAASPSASFRLPRLGHTSPTQSLRHALLRGAAAGSPLPSFRLPSDVPRGSFRPAQNPSPPSSFRAPRPGSAGALVRDPGGSASRTPSNATLLGNPPTDPNRRRLSRWSAASDSDLVAEDMPPGLPPIGNALPFTTPSRKGAQRLWYLSDTLLGAGGFGGVYLGMSEKGLLVAIKQMEISPEKTSQLRNEIKLLSKFQHNSIVAYLGSAVVGPHVLVVMEYAPTSLAKVLLNFGKLSEPCARRYTRDILRGLKYLHANHVIHRDVKPQNVLIGPNGRCKLADFGTAALLHKVQQGGELVMGTPHYMAPEVVRGHVGAGADVWALGVTLWEMVTGQLLDDCQEMTNIAAVMFHFGMMTEAPQIPHEFSDDLKDFLRRCLCPEPAERTSAADLILLPFVA